MAVSWGKKNSASNWMQLGYEFTPSPKEVGGGTSSVKVRLRIWVRTRWRVSDVDNSRKVSGNWPAASGNITLSHTGNNQTTKVYDQTITVNTSYTSTVKRSFSASLSGIEASPGTVSVSGTYTVGKRPNRAPTKPTWDSTERPNATSAKGFWTNHPSTAGPIIRNRFQRYDNLGKKWVTVSTPSATAKSATASGLPANALHELRVRAEGPGGNSGWATSGTFATTPSPPTNLVAKKKGQDIELTLTDTAATTERVRRYIIYDYPDNGSSVQVADISMNSMPFVHKNPDPSKTHRYRARAKINSIGDWESEVSPYSNTVQLQAPPLAPTVEGPDGTHDRDGSVTLRWTHNPVDTTDQTEAEVTYELPGEPDETVTVTGSGQEWTIPAGGVSGTVEWSVRTRGDHANFGPWSSTAAFQVGQVPTGVIQNEEDVSESAIAEVFWLFEADDDTQASWEVRLLDSNEEVLEDDSGSGGDTGYEFRTVLEDEQTYTYWVRVTSGNGLVSQPDTFTFVTDFPLPQAATPIPSWDMDTGTVSVGFDVQPVLGDETVAVAAGLERRDPGGDWVYVGPVEDWDDTVPDYDPSMQEPEYRVLTMSEAGAARYGQVVKAVRDRGLWPAYLTDGDGLVLQIWDNLRPGIEQERGKTRHKWAGRKYPTTKWGQHRDETWSLPFTINPWTPGVTSVADIRALEDTAKVICYRDVLGTKVYGTVDSVSVDVARDGWYSLSVSLTREEKREDTSIRRVGDSVLEDPTV